MNRADFQKLADVRIREAEILLAAGAWDGAYYMAGYAVEFGLKACIAKLTNQYDFPPDKERVGKIYSHKLDELVRVAGLRPQLDARTASDRAFGDNWKVVKDWTEAARYARWTEAQAEAMYDAITDAAHGVLPWITGLW